MTSPAITKAYASTQSGQIHYHFSLPPQNVPKKPLPILLFHKSASSSLSYVALMSKLSAAGYTCYAPDMPGFRNSFDPSPNEIQAITSRGLDWYTGVFLSAFENIGVFRNGNTKAHIIGHHSGAALALHIAYKHPAMVVSITLIGAPIMSASFRREMRDKTMHAFNAPDASGSHLKATWDYLARMGVGEDIELQQRELLDHVSAWKGRLLIYGAVWDQDSEMEYKGVGCDVLLMCAREDVLWPFFEGLKGLKEGVEAVEVQGANFEPDRDAEGVFTQWMQRMQSEGRQG